MNHSAPATISVQGSARVRQRPSFLVLLGKIHASAPTLELALQDLRQKREAFSRWLAELAAENLHALPDVLTLGLGNEIEGTHLKSLYGGVGSLLGVGAHHDCPDGL